MTLDKKRLKGGYKKGWFNFHHCYSLIGFVLYCACTLSRKNQRILCVNTVQHHPPSAFVGVERAGSSYVGGYWNRIHNGDYGLVDIIEERTPGVLCRSCNGGCGDTLKWLRLHAKASVRIYRLSHSRSCSLSFDFRVSLTNVCVYGRTDRATAHCHSHQCFPKKSLKMACRTCFVEWTDAGRRKREDIRQTASIGGITLTRRLC
jgi:hypothetical protein